ncbi:MAG: MucR family transcriptional regulator [Pseudomonadota bacterium]|nr:MucR family transcriptional regulator [Pseudomonadota bacterium]
MDSVDHDELVQLTADIVSAYVSNNKVGSDELGKIIEDVHSALQRAPGAQATPEPEPREPAVSIRRSVTPDHIVCLEDGKKFKSLKRHLQGEHGLSPDEYRSKWGLARDYPMVAPNYARARSDLAKSMGLGRKAGAVMAPAAAAEEVEQENAAPRRGRRPRAAK